MALAGELIVTRSLEPYQEARYLQLVELLRGADVAFGNSECLFHNYEGSPVRTTQALECLYAAWPTSR